MMRVSRALNPNMSVTRVMKGAVLAVSMALLGGCASIGGDMFSGSGSKAQNPYGAYLAGRHAVSTNNPRDAAIFYDAALKNEPGDPVILERAFMAALVGNDMERALPLAERLIEVEPGQRLARLILSLADVKKGDFSSAHQEIAEAAPGPFTALVGVLTTAWAATGEGNRELALEKLETFDGRAAFALFRAYHQGLMLELLNDDAGAEEAYRAAMETSSGSSIRVVQAYSSFLARRGQADAAKTILSDFLALSPEHPLAAHELAELNAGKRPMQLVSNAAEGVAEALYGLGSALATDTSSNLAELYLGLAIYMRPDFDIARSLLAGSYEAQQRWEDTIKAYKAISRKSPLYMNAQMQTALALDKLDRQDEGLAILAAMEKEFPQSVEPLVAAGDIYRSREKYAEAETLYAKAITLAGEPEPQDWILYYARGICRERLGQWKSAEADLLLALELSEDHPLVLNYLGYSWIEQHHRLDEALAMIEKAVERRPNDGFIVDSLGWARYRLGQYDLAVRYLERAVELQPGDPTINEHLGDALWKVGRRIEARFQWQHALAMEPEENRESILRAKLDRGLEAGEAMEAERVNPGEAVLQAGS